MNNGTTTCAYGPQGEYKCGLPPTPQQYHEGSNMPDYDIKYKAGIECFVKHNSVKHKPVKKK